MGNVDITGVDKCDNDGTTLRLSVRGCEVLAFFPVSENRKALIAIKEALMNVYISDLASS